MAITRNIGLLLLAIYLIVIGLMPLLGFVSFPPIVLSLLALAAGIFILIGR